MSHVATCLRRTQKADAQSVSWAKVVSIKHRMLDILTSRYGIVPPQQSTHCGLQTQPQFGSQGSATEIHAKLFMDKNVLQAHSNIKCPARGLSYSNTCLQGMLEPHNLAKQQVLANPHQFCIAFLAKQATTEVALHRIPPDSLVTTFNWPGCLSTGGLPPHPTWPNRPR